MFQNQTISKNDSNLLKAKYGSMQRVYKKLNMGYPIQYLIGYVDFYGVKIYVDKRVLIPRFETEYLVAKTIKLIDKFFKKDINILDAGTGSGCIAIRLKKEYPKTLVMACDKSLFALNLAKKNAKENKLNISFFYSKFKNIRKTNIDVLISNPPYISSDESIAPDVKKYEPKIALYGGKDGLIYYKEIIKKSLEILNKKSIIALEIGFNQEKQITRIIKNYYPNAQILIEKDLQGKFRYIFVINNM